ncbi:hypothetical protein ElyMa_002070800 [Elysia marginata]|uniref:Secreted protein n=1 Tax=Elysia marginata TaxID=1093978 RepID=A0AAV4FBI9_9GAST|nr:hypothetical protein ElyMa_002070800 [Elysia marginata]
MIRGKKANRLYVALYMYFIFITSGRTKARPLHCIINIAHQFPSFRFNLRRPYIDDVGRPDILSSLYTLAQFTTVLARSQLTVLPEQLVPEVIGCERNSSSHGVCVCVCVCVKRSKLTDNKHHLF